MAERTHFDQERQRELSQPSLLFRAILSLTCGSNLGFPDDNHRAFHPGQQVQIDLGQVDIYRDTHNNVPSLMARVTSVSSGSVKPSGLLCVEF